MKKESWYAQVTAQKSKQFKRKFVNILELKLLITKREFPSVDCIWPSVCSSPPPKYTISGKVEMELKQFPILHFNSPEKNCKQT